jgi:RNA polymerase sigma-70 factor (ECF subfamily)
MMRRYKAMVEQCRHRIYSLAYHSLGSREEAEDVTQEVLIRLWEHLHELTDRHVLPWVIRVTRNACLDLHRKRQTRQALLDQHQNENPGMSHSESSFVPGLSLDQDDFRRQVRAALGTIEEPYRTIVILREIEDLTYQQIAAAMEMPLNSVKVNLHRGRRMLREKFRALDCPMSGGLAHEQA